MSSPRYERYVDLYKDNYLFVAFRRATRGATRNQTSLLVQLHTGHAPLNKHLHWISKVDADICRGCKEHVESVAHYLLECRSYEDERDRMLKLIGSETTDMKTLFGSREGIKAMLQYVEDTGRLRKSFGDVAPLNMIEMDNNSKAANGNKEGCRWPDSREG